MNLKSLRYIITIAEEQNLTKASKRLFVSQSTLSLFLRKLEEELGLSLFERSKNKLTITPAGRLYAETARELLHMEEKLYEKLNLNKKSQTLNIGISSLMVMSVFSQTISEFTRQFPNFTVNVTEGRAVALMELLYQDKLDVIIIGRPEIVKDERCHTEVWKHEKVFLLIPPKHPHADVASSTNYYDPPVADMSLFANETFALTPRNTCDYQIADKIFKDYNMNASITWEMNNTQTLCNMVLDGICLSAIPSYCIPRDKGLLVCQPPHAYYRYVLCMKRKGHTASSEEEQLLQMVYNNYIHYYD